MSLARLSRAVFLNLCQLGIVVLAGVLWNGWFSYHSLLEITDVMPPLAEGAVVWLVGTFVFYWWHRMRHESDLLWRVMHQIHHSASRIEILTSFYKHPVEIAANSVIVSVLVFGVLGGSIEGAAWFNVFAAVGEMFYHSNLRTPRWVVCSCSDRSITRSIMSAVFIASIMVTSRGGIASSGRFEIPRGSRCTAASRTTSRPGWERCCCSVM